MDKEDLDKQPPLPADQCGILPGDCDVAVMTSDKLSGSCPTLLNEGSEDADAQEGNHRKAESVDVYDWLTCHQLALPLYRSHSAGADYDHSKGIGKRKRGKDHDVKIRITGATFDHSYGGPSQENLAPLSPCTENVEPDANVFPEDLMVRGPLEVPSRPRSLSMPSFEFIDESSQETGRNSGCDGFSGGNSSWTLIGSGSKLISKMRSLSTGMLSDSDIDGNSPSPASFCSGYSKSVSISDISAAIGSPVTEDGMSALSTDASFDMDTGKAGDCTLEKTPNYHLIGTSSQDLHARCPASPASSPPAQPISLFEALIDPSVTAATSVNTSSAAASSQDLHYSQTGAGKPCTPGDQDFYAFPEPRHVPASSTLPLNSAAAFLKKNKKEKYRRGSKIFEIGGSRSRKSKEEAKRCQQTHSFVSVSFSNTTPCQICGKPLAHKQASQCQNCLLTCHVNSCLEQIDACPFSGISWNSRSTGSMRTGDRGGLLLGQPAAGSPGGTVAGSGFPVVPSVIIDKMIAEHGYAPDNVPDATCLGLIDPKLASQPLKRLSVPSSFETQQQEKITNAQSETNLSASSPGSSRRPISPGSFSRWRYVADKLLKELENNQGQADYYEHQDDSDRNDCQTINYPYAETLKAKPCTTDTHADSDSEDNSGYAAAPGTGAGPVENPDVKDVLPYARLLDFDPELRLAVPEPEAWSMMHDKEYLSTLSEKEIKRQDIIHELIQTEKNHCAVLLIIDQIYIRGLRYELQWPETEIQKFFPSFADIFDVHMKFFRQLRARQQASKVISMIGDVLIDQFDGERGDRMKRAYGEFCSHHKEASQIYKSKLQKDRRFAAFDMKCVEKLKCHTSRFDIPSCVLLVTQRISKYRLLIESIYNKTDEDSPDRANVARAFQHVKDVLTSVDGSIGAEERRKRLNEIYRAMDSKSSAFINGEEWKKHQLFDRALICDGLVQFRKPNGKLVEILALLLSDCIVFLQENNQKFTFAHVDDKPPVIPLNRIIIRPKAERSGIPEKSLFLISSGVGARPEMCELICNTVKECEKWRTEIESACTALRQQEEARAAAAFSQELTTDDAQIQKLREVIGICQAKDKNISQLCEEKCDLLRETIDFLGIPRWRMNLPPSLNSAITEDNLAMDQMQNIINAAFGEIGKLMPQQSPNGGPIFWENMPVTSGIISPPPASALSVPQPSSPGPKRAETFGGFDGNKDGNKDGSGGANRSTSLKDPGRNRRPTSILGSLNQKMDKPQTTIGEKSSSLSSGSISASRDSCATADSSSSAISSSSVSGGSPRMSALFAAEESGQITAQKIPSVLQLHWYLNQIADGLARQSTAYESLKAKYAEAQLRLTVLEARDRKVNKHSVQLEELRSLQEAFMKEKNQFNSERENENQWFKQKRQEIDRETVKLKSEKEDLEKQRNAMFSQCEKLRENGLDVVLSNHAPFVQIFPSSLVPLLPVHPLTVDDSTLPAIPPPVLPAVNRLPSTPHSFVIGDDSRPPRPALPSSHSLNQIRVPGGYTTAAAGPPSVHGNVATMPSEGNRLRPPGSVANAVGKDSKQALTGSIAGNWKGSMESLHKKTEAAKEKIRSFYDGSHGLDRTDSAQRNGKPPPIRTTSEAKLGISNLMHLSEKTSIINGSSSLTGSDPHREKDGKKRSSDKKRSFL